MRKNGRFNAYEDFTKESGFDFALHSTIGCGGKAETLFCPKTERELSALRLQLKKDKFPFFIVGNLSNVLPPDGEVEAAIISLKHLKQIVASDTVYVGAGVTSSALLRSMQSIGKSGAEFLAGIPCTLGGALYMNAGVNGAHISDIVDSVIAVSDGGVKVLSLSDCDYGYKNSRFMQTDEIILGAHLRLHNKDAQTVKEKIKGYLQKRAHLPKGKSMGCVFKNPQNVSMTAGELIERSGLKGKRIGGARIADLHANFIINDGATSAEIKALIAFVKNEVYKRQGITLEEEIRYLR